ncbi:hypothetical protein [Azotobacter beijerinckii]|uniref:hypothetical protein n=1 Tax=Azotobacter beijerinckii TaxID=170623 RepID=UPI001160E1FB|nr:hypothetical protein [Azotobacter beijerinckii]
MHVDFGRVRSFQAIFWLEFSVSERFVFVGSVLRGDRRSPISFSWLGEEAELLRDGDERAQWLFGNAVRSKAKAFQPKRLVLEAI